VPILVIALVAAAFAYVAGIAAVRMLGAKVASFVALTEVLFAVLFAWLVLAELPTPIQLAGGLLIIGGVVAVRADEPRVAVVPDQIPASTDAPAPADALLPARPTPAPARAPHLHPSHQPNESFGSERAGAPTIS
jgi:hypothetical protein